MLSPVSVLWRPTVGLDHTSSSFLKWLTHFNGEAVRLDSFSVPELMRNHEGTAEPLYSTLKGGPATKVECIRVVIRLGWVWIMADTFSIPVSSNHLIDFHLCLPCPLHSRCSTGGWPGIGVVGGEGGVEVLWGTNQGDGFDGDVCAIYPVLLINCLTQHEESDFFFFFVFAVDSAFHLIRYYLMQLVFNSFFEPTGEATLQLRRVCLSHHGAGSR